MFLLYEITKETAGTSH